MNLGKNLHVCHSLELGGITTFVKALIDLNGVSNVKHEVLVWQKSSSILNENIIDISKTKQKKDAFESVIKDYDRIFVHSLKPFMLKSLVKRKNNVYIFQHGVTFGEGYKSYLIRLYYFLVFNCFLFKIICSSNFAKKKLLNKVVLFNEKQIKIVPFGISIKRQENITPTNDTLIIGTAGRLVKQKRFDKILNALNALNYKMKVHLKIAGDGVLMDDLKKQSENLNSKLISVEFKGELKNMDSFYSSLDVFILASYKESYGLVVLEALSYNVPVIVFSDTGACTDFIINDKNGFVLNNEKELSEKLCELKSVDVRRELKNKTAGIDLSNFSIIKTRSLLDNDII